MATHLFQAYGKRVTDMFFHHLDEDAAVLRDLGIVIW
jgi:hypothetical protein